MLAAYWFRIVTRVSQYCTVCLFVLVLFTHTSKVCATALNDSSQNPWPSSKTVGHFVNPDDTVIHLNIFFFFFICSWFLLPSYKAWMLKLQVEGLWNRCYCVVAWGLIHKILSSFHCKRLSISVHSTYVIVMSAVHTVLLVVWKCTCFKSHHCLAPE